jgi:adenylate kinase
MNLIFLGPPGAGKGTTASKAATEFGIPHISTGDLFRAAIKNETELGLRVKAITEKGDLVPDDLTVEIVKERLQAPDSQKGYILDGFPRTIPQAEALSGFSSITRVLNFELDDHEVVERLSGRRVCKACGAGYHVRFMPPKKEGVCDVCGGELYTRKDDTIESIKNRLNVYSSQTSPLIDYYTKRQLLTDVDAKPSAEEVLQSVIKTLKTT